MEIKPIRRDYTLGNYVVPKDCHGGVAVDIGANIGNFPEKYHGTFSSIHFYEPIGSCYELCVRKTREMANVRGFHEGVFSEDSPLMGVRMNRLDPYETGCVLDLPHINQLDPGKKYFTEPFEKVPTVSLETVLERAGGKVDYLKVDCEGSEYYVLNKKDLSKIRYVTIEFHAILGADKWRELCLWLNRTHMIIHPEIVDDPRAFLVPVPGRNIIEVLYAPRIPGMTYATTGEDEYEPVPTNETRPSTTHGFSRG